MYNNKFLLLIFGLWFCCTANAQKIPDVINIKDVVATELSCENFMDGKIEVAVQDVTCNGDAHSGEITVVATGGIPPLSYTLLNENKTVNSNVTGAVSGIFTSVPVNCYHIVVEDAASCTDTVFNVWVHRMKKPDLKASEIDKIKCWNEKATIIIHATPYNQEGSSENTITAYWLKGALYGQPDPTKDNKFDALNGDTYTLYAQDSHGCIGDTTVIIDEPKSPILINLVEEVRPFGNNKGSFTVEISGGWEGYTFVLSKFVGPSQQVLLTRNDQQAGKQSFLDLDAAMYRIHVTEDQGGCTKTNPFVWTLEMITGETDFRSDLIKIFPNPSENGRFIIEWNNNENRKVTLELYNVLGQLVYKTGTQTGANAALDVSGQSCGAYLLYIPELNIRQKLIIQ